MESTINKRIEEIIEYFGMNVSSFSKLIGVAQTSLRDCVKGGAEPKYSTLNKIIIAKPLISSEWLLTGNGNMLKEDLEDLKAIEEELLMLKGENRVLREQLGLQETKGHESA